MSILKHSVLGGAISRKIAAIDLGSNSFHMLLAEVDEQLNIKILETRGEKVRLAAGLSAASDLTQDAIDRGIECLERFAQRLKHIEPSSVVVVGTNTLRRAHNRHVFIEKAEQVLGHRVDVISGREEARLIYVGVSNALSSSDQEQRLVIDIGGGSTEIIIGKGSEPLTLESLHMGCISFSQRFFPNNTVTRDNFEQAVNAAASEFVVIAQRYRELGWDFAIGSSGTIRAVAQVIDQNQWGTCVTLQGLKQIKEKLIAVSDVDKIKLSGLKDSRKPSIAGGLAILFAAFKVLGIDSLEYSSGALREGVVQELVGRDKHEDVRDRTVNGLMKSFQVDTGQALRVLKDADHLWQQVGNTWVSHRMRYYLLLQWACMLHEVGLTISHSQFHKHGAYLLQHADLFGFSQSLQTELAALVRGHRMKFPVELFSSFDDKTAKILMRTCILVRLAVLLNRGRGIDDVPKVDLKANGSHIDLRLPEGWLAVHPLTRSDLEKEVLFMKQAGYVLSID